MSIDNWYAKIKRQVPSWVFEKDQKSRSVVYGIASVFNAIELNYKEHITETQIDNASEEYLIQIGEERGKPRIDGELLSIYRKRVKEIVNRSNCPAIKSLVDDIIINGESLIVEHDNFGLFYMNRSAYLNRGILPTELLYNAFTIFVPSQIPEPVTFLNRENFLNTEDLLGSSESSISLFQQIINTVNINKAFGEVYRLYEQQ